MENQSEASVLLQAEPQIEISGGETEEGVAMEVQPRRMIPLGAALPQPPPRPVYPAPVCTHDEVCRDRNTFLNTLRNFHYTMGSKFMNPVLGGGELDLLQLYVQVTERGGIERVISEGRWREVITTFNFPSTTTSASYVLRKYYVSLLFHFEQVYYFRAEGPIADPSGILESKSYVSKAYQYYRKTNPFYSKDLETVSTRRKRSLAEAQFQCVGQSTTQAAIGNRPAAPPALAPSTDHVPAANQLPTVAPTVTVTPTGNGLRLGSSPALLIPETTTANEVAAINPAHKTLATTTANVLPISTTSNALPTPVTNPVIAATANVNGLPVLNPAPLSVPTGNYGLPPFGNTGTSAAGPAAGYSLPALGVPALGAGTVTVILNPATGNGPPTSVTIPIPSTAGNGQAVAIPHASATSNDYTAPPTAASTIPMAAGNGYATPANIVFAPPTGNGYPVTGSVALTDAPGIQNSGTVMGIIDGKFEHGYFVTVTVNGQDLRGVIYQVVDKTTVDEASSSTVTPDAAPPVQNTMSSVVAPRPGHISQRRSSTLKYRNPVHLKPNGSAYNFFFAEKYSQLRVLLPQREREFTKIIGESWSQLSEEEREVYYDFGRRDKERYMRELNEYRG